MPVPWDFTTFEVGARMGKTCCYQVSYNILLGVLICYINSIFGTLLDVTINEDDSVSQVCSQMFRSQLTSLDKCLQQYTEQELVS